jgi:hypothetical protein
MGGEEGKNGKDYDMAGEEGKNGGEDYDGEDYASAGSGDDNGDTSRDADFVPKLFESCVTTMTSIISMMMISMKRTGASRTGTVKREFRLDAVGGVSLWGDLLRRIISLCQPPKPVRPEASIRVSARNTVTVFTVRG